MFFHKIQDSSPPPAPHEISLGLSRIALYILNTSCQLLGMRQFVVRSLRILALTEEEVNLITA